MLHHEEFPEKPHYNMAIPYFPLLPAFLVEMFRHPPLLLISINFEKVNHPPYEVGREGVRTMTSSSWNIDLSFFRNYQENF